jgi:hypothetical protein
LQSLKRLFHFFVIPAPQEARDKLLTKSTEMTELAISTKKPDELFFFWHFHTISGKYFIAFRMLGIFINLSFRVNHPVT